MRGKAAGFAATLGAVAGYALATLGILPRPYFYPHLGQASWAAIGDEPAIRWYGSVAYLLLGGVLGGLLGSRLPEPLLRRLAVVVPAVTLLVLVWMERRWF